ncbi:MAG TPA: hypothetical protein VNA20_15595 [Frankiaceae bacterium]|nr:hypothetical protein [Frankiaceae bacterium]
MNVRAPLLALALVPLTGPAATAAPPQFVGQLCGYRTTVVQKSVPPGSFGREGAYTGIVSFAGALYSDEAGLVAGDVSCVMKFDGVPRTVLEPVSVAVAGAGAARLSFHQRADTVVVMCTVVDFADATPTREICVHPGQAEFPSLFVKEAVWTVSRPVETAACAAIGALAPGSGEVEVTPEGDVYVGDEWTLDCLPYANPR